MLCCPSTCTTIQNITKVEGEEVYKVKEIGKRYKKTSRIERKGERKKERDKEKQGERKEGRRIEGLKQWKSRKVEQERKFIRKETERKRDREIQSKNLTKVRGGK